MNVADTPKASPPYIPQGGNQPPIGFHPPPPPYSPGVAHPPHGPIIQNIAPLPLGPESTRAVCPSCRATIMTRLEHETTTKTHLICLVMCIFGLWPCCVAPYLIDSCKNSSHYCPSCGAFLGTYNR